MLSLAKMQAITRRTESMCSWALANTNGTPVEDSQGRLSGSLAP